MNTKCCECQQQKSDMQILLCRHFICKHCMPVYNYGSQIILTCSQCHVMTILTNEQDATYADPDSFIVCLDCRSQLMSTRMFLQSQHRKHDVTTVSKIADEVQRNLKKYQLSLDLQNKVLYQQIQQLHNEKKTMIDQYNHKSVEIKHIFNELKQAIEQSQQICSYTYEKLINNIIQEMECKIRQTRLRILKCESSLQSITHSITRVNDSKQVFTVNFYLQNIHFVQQLMQQLIQKRKKSINQFSKQVQINFPHLQQIIEIKNKIKKIDFWAKQVKQIQNSKPVTIYLQNKTATYFERKRKQIFNYFQDVNSLTQTSIADQEFKISKVGGKQQKDLYSIEERIENLRKTLKLGDRSVNSTKTNLSLSYNIL